MAVVDVGLLHPSAYRGLGQIEIASDAPDRVARLAHQRNDLGLELLGERPTTAGLLASHRLHHDGHPLRGYTPDRGCPSNQVRPTMGTRQRESIHTEDMRVAGGRVPYRSRHNDALPPTG